MDILLIRNAYCLQAKRHLLLSEKEQKKELKRIQYCSWWCERQMTKEINQYASSEAFAPFPIVKSQAINILR